MDINLDTQRIIRIDLNKQGQMPFVEDSMRHVWRLCPDQIVVMGVPDQVAANEIAGFRELVEVKVFPQMTEEAQKALTSNNLVRLCSFEPRVPTISST